MSKTITLQVEPLRIWFEQYHFHKKVISEMRLRVSQLHNKLNGRPRKYNFKGDNLISDKDIESCPEVVARYLNKTGVVGQRRKKSAHLIHDGEFRLKPKQKWFPIQGEYNFDLESPTFDWRATIKMFPLISVSVKDSYIAGVGRTVVKLNPVFPISNETSKEISESSLGRLLVEFLMIPTALVPSEKLRWEGIDARRARVVFSDREFHVSAIFEFGSDGFPVRTTIDRFGKFDGKVTRKPFICDLSNFRVFEGLLIPTDIRGCWDLAGELFYWFHFKIKSAHYE